MKKNILVIEDDAALASLLTGGLVSAGFEVEVAVDGEMGLKAIEKKPDLILLDIMLPKMDGLTLMQKIREKDEWGVHVPIIIASNLSPDDSKVLKSVSTYPPIFFLVKADNSIDAIVEKVSEILKSK